MKKVFTLLSSLLVALFILPIPVHAAEALQGMIKYYTINDGANFIRSTAPFTSGVATQTKNSDGSVTVSVNSALGYADSGFVVYNGKLGDLSNFSLNGVGQYGLNLWFDVDNDNEFFTWNSSNVLTGLGSDSYGLGPQAAGGNLSVNSGSTFWMMTPPYGSYSLAQLQDSEFAGINKDTHITIWVGVNATGTSVSATISGFPLTNKDQCKMDGWKAYTNPTFKNQGDCVSYVQSSPKATGNKSK